LIKDHIPPEVVEKVSAALTSHIREGKVMLKDGALVLVGLLHLTTIVEEQLHGINSTLEAIRQELEKQR
jgi:hypothetical protein